MTHDRRRWLRASTWKGWAMRLFHRPRHVDSLSIGAVRKKTFDAITTSRLASATLDRAATNITHTTQRAERRVAEHSLASALRRARPKNPLFSEGEPTAPSLAADE